MKIKGYQKFIQDKKSVKQFRRGGEDLPELLRQEAEGIIDALDVKIMFHQFKHQLYTIAPIVSLVKNIGHDGSGIHCGISDKFVAEFDESDIKLRMIKDIQPNNAIIHGLYVFRSGGINGKIERFLKRSRIIFLIRALFRMKGRA
jgi:hypothetical protein